MARSSAARKAEGNEIKLTQAEMLVLFQGDDLTDFQPEQQLEDGAMYVAIRDGARVNVIAKAQDGSKWTLERMSRS